MICEMCGKSSPEAKPMMVEGTRLILCPACSKFGDGIKGGGNAPNGAPIASNIIAQRLERRERRMSTKDVYSTGTTLDLIDDYGGEIRKAREARNMDLEAFAQSILEKKGTLAKIESNNLIPDDKLIAKLEKALQIKLREIVQSGVKVGGSRKSEGMTLDHFIKKE